jgi:hypothetical protein
MRRLKRASHTAAGALEVDWRKTGRSTTVETASSKYPVRTEQNVVDSDGTLILFVARLQGGTLLTLRLTKKHSKPILLCDFEEQTSIDEMRQWIAEHDIRVLNVAGPRESTSPGIYTKAKSLIKRIIE